MSRVVWLLIIEFEGFTVTASTRPVTVTNASGRSHTFPGGLGAVEVTTSAQEGPVGRSVALEIAAPTGHTWASIHASGVRIGGARAVLRRWKPGMTLEEAPKRAEGAIRNPKWGRGPAPLVISLEAPPWGDQARVIPASRAVSSETFPTLTAVGFTIPYETDPQVVGTLPAVIVGHPGDLVDQYTSKTGNAPNDTAVEAPPADGPQREQVWADLVEGAPALMTDHFPYIQLGPNGRLSFASHQVVAEKILIWDQSDKRYDVFDVKHDLDLQGQLTPFVDWSSGTGGWVRSIMGHEYWAIFLDEDGYGGGLPSDQGGSMTGLGEFLSWLMRRIAVPTSVAAQQGARSVFDRFDIQTVINTDITVWDWVARNVLPVFPARYIEGPDSAYVAPYPVRGSASDLVDEIHPTRDGLEVVGEPYEDTTEIANHLVLVYQGGRKRAVLTSSTSTDRSERFDARCAWSQDQGWGKVEKTITSEIIHRDETAWAALRAMAPLVAEPRVDIFVETSSDRLDGLWMLDQVRVRAAEWGFPNRRGVVEVVTEINDTVRLGIRLFEELTE